MIDARSFLFRSLTAALVAAVCVAGSAQAQSRLSLAERVEQLERQTQGSGEANNLSDLLVRTQELQAEVQSLRGLVEQQSFEIEGLKKRQRDQYVDLDSRLQRLEGGMTVPTRPTATPGTIEGQAPAQLDEDDTQTTMSEVESPPATPAAPPMGAEMVGGGVTTTSAPEESQAYETAFEALKQGRYAEASQLFSAFLAQYPNGELAANATYWLGESYYVTQNYKLALETFQSLLSRFPDSRKAPDTLLKVGYCQYELGDTQRAAATLNEVVARYPDTPVARLAQGRLRALRLDGR
jgi:tol-pal system protein YbgF